MLFWMATSVKPLSDGKSYHFHVIYNHAQSLKKATNDQKLSLQFVKFLVEKLSSVGYTECYYHAEHSLPGRNVFDELFRVLTESEWTVIVVTKEFSTDYWSTYCRNAIFKKLIDERKEDSLIPIAIGIDTIPDELTAKQWLYFEDDPKTWSEGEVKKVIKVFDAGLPVNKSDSNTPEPDPEDGRLRTEGNQLVANPQSSLSFTSISTQDSTEKDLCYIFARLLMTKTQP